MHTNLIDHTPPPLRGKTQAHMFIRMTEDIEQFPIIVDLLHVGISPYVSALSRIAY